MAEGFLLGKHKRIMSLKIISEHDLVKKYGHDQWQSTLQESFDKCDVFIQYACVEENELTSKVRIFAEQIDSKLNVTVFEECTEKGGGGEFGILPSLLEYLFKGGAVVFSIAATGFIQEMGKEAYEKFSEAFGHFKSQMSANGSLTVTLHTESGNEYIYYYPKHLSAEQAIEGFRSMKTHFSLDDSSFLENRFVYFPKTAEWIRL